MLFWGRDLPDEVISGIVREIAGDAERLGYQVEKQSADGMTFVVAVRASGPFPWPDMPSLESVIGAMELMVLGTMK